MAMLIHFDDDDFRCLAPEAIRGADVGVPADVFSIGVLLYQLLTGHAPHAGAGMDLIREIVIGTEEPQPPSSLVPGLPPAVDAVLRRALARDPRERFTTPGELADALERAADEAVLDTSRETVAALVRDLVGDGGTGDPGPP